MGNEKPKTAFIGVVNAALFVLSESGIELFAKTPRFEHRWMQRHPLDRKAYMVTGFVSAEDDNGQLVRTTVTRWGGLGGFYRPSYVVDEFDVNDITVSATSVSIGGTAWHNGVFGVNAYIFKIEPSGHKIEESINVLVAVGPDNKFYFLS